MAVIKLKKIGYLVCDICGGYYELQPGESPNDFGSCECGGKLKYIESLNNTEKIVFCPNCGIKTLNEYIFCENCGYGLKSVNNVSSSTQTSNLQIELNDFTQWNYETHKTAISLGWISFFYAVPVFLSLHIFLIGAYLTTRNNIRAKLNGKTIMALGLILICEMIIIAII